jgi:outer membrane protein assembly factor BamB
MLIFGLLIWGCSKTPVSQRFDWPRWRGPEGNGISRETGWNPKALDGGPRVVWKVNIGHGFSSVVIQEDRLYTMGFGDGNFVYCLNARNGKVLWRYSFPGYDAPQATPTVEESSLYCLTRDGILFCLNSQNGKLRWQKDLVAEYGAVKPFYGFAGSPVVVGDLLILNANTSGMALDKTTGEKTWGSEKPPDTVKYADLTGTGYSTPVIYSHGEKRYALVSSYKGTFSVEIETGKSLLLFDWEKSYRFSYCPIADPLIFEDRLFIVRYRDADPGSVMLDVQGQEAKVLWESRDIFSRLGSPAYFDGFLYVCQGGGNTRGSLRCLDPKTGKVEWEESLAGGRGQDSVSFLVADGKLIVLNDKGMLSIAEASPKGFNVISSCDVLAGGNKPRKFWTPPVLCNGRIYCRNFSGDLVCIDVSR